VQIGRSNASHHQRFRTKRTSRREISSTKEVGFGVVFTGSESIKFYWKKDFTCIVRVLTQIEITFEFMYDKSFGLEYLVCLRQKTRVYLMFRYLLARYQFLGFSTILGLDPFTLLIASM
jgi:hypothetical protein